MGLQDKACSEELFINYPLKDYCCLHHKKYILNCKIIFLISKIVFEALI